MLEDIDESDIEFENEDESEEEEEQEDWKTKIYRNFRTNKFNSANNKLIN
jgi:hypothetical protein